jgi:hypothetical protein
MPQPSNPNEPTDLQLPHLLYVNDPGMDHDKLQAVLDGVTSYPLGSAYCWIVLLPEREFQPFSDTVSLLLSEDDSNELLLCRLSGRQILHETGDGFGLSGWIKKNGC